MADTKLESTLREAITADPQSYNALAAATGLARPSIVRFVKGEGTLRLDHAAALCDYYGLELVKKQAE